jgi:hypothetical protein
MDTTQHVEPSEDHHSPKKFCENNLELISGLFTNVLGHRFVDLPQAVAFGYNAVAGKGVKKLHEGYQLTDDQKQLARNAYLLPMGWAAGMMPPPGDRDHNILMAGRDKGNMMMFDGQLSSMGGATRYGLYWALTGERQTDDLDMPTEQFFGQMSYGAQIHPFIDAQMSLGRDALKTEFFRVMATLVGLTHGNVRFGPFVPSEDTEPSVEHAPLRTIKAVDAFLPFKGKTITIVNAPAVERPGKVPAPNSTSVIKYWFREYRTLIRPRQSVTLEQTRPGLRAAAAASMEFRASEQAIYGTKPTIDVRGHCLPTEEGEYDEFTITWLNELINMMSKGVQEDLNERRSKMGMQPLTSGQIRKVLDRMYQEPLVEHGFGYLMGATVNM